MKTQRDTQYKEKADKKEKIMKSVRLSKSHIEYIDRRGEPDFSAYVRRLIEADMGAPVDFVEQDDMKMKYWADFIIRRLSELGVTQQPQPKGRRGKKDPKINIPDGLRRNIQKLLEDDDDD